MFRASWLTTASGPTLLDGSGVCSVEVIVIVIMLVMP